jgi:hypothetical protein
VPSITVDPLISGAGAMSGQTPPLTSLQVDATASGASQGQAWLSAGKLASSSTLGLGPAPKALMAKKLNVKKSSL